MSEASDDINYDFGPGEIPEHLSGLELAQKQNEIAIMEIVKGSFDDGDHPEKVL